MDVVLIGKLESYSLFWKHQVFFAERTGDFQGLKGSCKRDFGILGQIVVFHVEKNRDGLSVHDCFVVGSKHLGGSKILFIAVSSDTKPANLIAN